ncbi:MAG: hypothetical protein H6621_08560 [Halobacteriovoraceae bacterium]|nr:hypothetical protein [Halobacteriovoraceae bacterium]MCB9095104.1 hypothetical protein [Halobacteriovoraceae bacterium]
MILFLLVSFSSQALAQKNGVKKLSILRSKMIKGLRKSPYLKPKMNYTAYKNYTRKLARTRKLNRRQLETFLKLAQVDMVLYARTQSKLYRQEGLNSSYVAELYRYKSRQAQSVRAKIVQIDRLLTKKKARKQKVAKKRLPPKKIAKKEKKKKLVLKRKFSLYSTFISWQEDRLAKDQTGAEFLLYAQLRGYCTGIAYDFVFNNFHMTSHACFFGPLSTIDISGEQSGVYDKSDIATMGIMTGAGVSFDIKPEQFIVTTGMDLIYRSNDWENSGDLDVDGDTLITLGLYGQTEISRGPYAFDFKLGYGLAFLSAYWQFGIKYYF